MKKLDFAEAYYLAPNGRISVRWDRTSAGISIRLCVPEGTRGELVLPEGYRLPDDGREMTLDPGETLKVLVRQV